MTELTSRARLHCRIGYSLFGIAIGVSVFVIWLTVFDNGKETYATVTYGGLSGVLAAWNLILHIMHYQDLWRTWLKGLRLFVGGGLLFLGITGISFVTFLVLAIYLNQSDLVRSYYITAIWCALSAKWSFLLFWHSRSYRNEFADLTALLEF
ncbi:heme transporter hrg1-B [Ciona intestinalis]